MVEPIDAIRAIHNAFRNDLICIDAAALDGEGKGRACHHHRTFPLLQPSIGLRHAHGEQ